LAEELHRSFEEPDRLEAMGRAARESSKRFAWHEVARRVVSVYERATEVAAPSGVAARARRRLGIDAADGLPRTPATKLPSIDPALPGASRWTAARKAALGVVGIAAVALTLIAAERIGVRQVAGAIVDSDLSWVFVALALMATSLFVRAEAWRLITRAALPASGLKRRDFASATMIGVLMSATLPARLGEPARAVALARHTGQVRQALPVVVGTIVSQAMLNLLALLVLGVVILASTDLFAGSSKTLLTFSLVPVALLAAVALLPAIVRRGNGDGRLARVQAAIHSVLVQVRSGLSIFRHPRYGVPAALIQLFAWAIQVASCWALLIALGLDVERALAASAAVLFAVNVTAVIPATPSNIGIFQLAVITVLTTGFGVSAADALAYGVILQAVEFATAVVLGVPALLREGLSWGDLKAQAMAASPVELEPSRRQRDTAPGSTA